MSLNILSLDIATKTGYAVYINGQCVEDGLIKSAPKKSEHELSRVVKFREAVKDILNRYPAIDTIAWERVDFCKFTKAHAVHHELLSVVHTLIVDADMQYCNVSVSALKRYATGSGKASKELMVSTGNKRWGTSYFYDSKKNTVRNQDNEVDARWVGDYFVELSRKA